jgi:hypothetical protein
VELVGTDHEEIRRGEGESLTKGERRYDWCGEGHADVEFEFAAG